MIIPGVCDHPDLQLVSQAIKNSHFGKKWQYREKRAMLVVLADPAPILAARAMSDSALLLEIRLNDGTELKTIRDALQFIEAWQPEIQQRRCPFNGRRWENLDGQQQFIRLEQAATARTALANEGR